jgi:hypothetical protein
MILIDPHVSVSFVDRHPWLVPLVAQIFIAAAKNAIPLVHKIRELFRSSVPNTRSKTTKHRRHCTPDRPPPSLQPSAAAFAKPDARR